MAVPPLDAPAASAPGRVVRPRAPFGPDALRGLCGGAVHLPGDPGYDGARRPWNLAVDQRPAAVAYPADADEAVEVLRVAQRHGLRVAVQRTGHAAAALPALEDVVVLRTAGMTNVQVDPVRRRARVGAGVLWEDVVSASSPFGLAGLHGSSPEVGVVGYTLLGGLGWLARSRGLASGSVSAAELVTADGTLLQVDAGSEPELLWALRGGGGGLGVVTALEFALHEVATAYAGWLVWDLRDAGRVLPAWAEWADAAPDEVTTALRLLRLPDLPAVPSPLRGRRLVVVDGAVVAPEPEAGRMLAPLRALAPESDTFATVPAEALARLHGDPGGPTAAVSEHRLLASLPAPAVDALLAVAGPDARTSVVSTELRQLGGALSRPAAGGGALALVEGRFSLFAVAVPRGDGAAHADVAAVAGAVGPWASTRRYAGFCDGRVPPGALWDAPTLRRLQAVRAAVDPTGRIVAAHAAPLPG
ncbi:FAD-binding oxidoreductase [Motilibacter sp. E257]|uniref:FAD-binding oxidoreductase n=1 Tax=Motilibacter deserti TaxID=2714956 RepID=A0ABX0GQU6_9ACTN|nr:FAD-binding oxidoreductase [Motilibacter deserti]